MELAPPPFETPEARQDLRSLATGTGIIAAGTIFGRLIHVLTDIWLARLFGPELFGIYSIGWNLHRLVSPIISLGIPNGTIVFGVKHWKKEPAKFVALFQTGLMVILLSGVSTAVVFWFSADWMAQVIFGKPDAAQTIRTVGLVMPFIMLLVKSNALTRVTRRMQYSIISSELVTSISMLLIFAILYWVTGQFWAVLASMLASYILAGLVAISSVYVLFPEMRQVKSAPWAPSARELLGFSIPTMFAGIFGLSDQLVNRVLAGVFFPAAQVGVYQAASQFNNLFGILLSSIAGAFMPFVASLHQSGEHKRLNELYKVTTKWSLYVSLPIIIITLLLPDQIMDFLYGSKYVQGAGLLIILTLGQLVNVSTGTTGGLFLMTGRQRNYLILTIASFCINILGSIALIPVVGIYAMAVGQLLASLVDNIIGTLWLAFDAQLWPYDARYFKGLLAGAGAAVIVWLTPGIPGNPHLSLILRSSLDVVVFILILWKMGFEYEDIEFWDLIKKRTASIFIK